MTPHEARRANFAQSQPQTPPWREQHPLPPPHEQLGETVPSQHIARPEETRTGAFAGEARGFAVGSATVAAIGGGAICAARRGLGTGVAADAAGLGFDAGDRHRAQLPTIPPKSTTTPRHPAPSALRPVAALRRPLRPINRSGYAESDGRCKVVAP